MVTTKEKESIHNVNGHSSHTAEVEYVMAQREDDVDNCRAIFERLQNEDEQHQRPHDEYEQHLDHTDFEGLFDEQEQPSQRPSTTQVRQPRRPAIDERLVHPNWGTSHEEYHKTGQRIKWTTKEKAYIGKYCEQKIKEKPDISCLIASCRQAILQDPKAIPIFHKHHLIKNDRLRAGYQAYLRDKEKQLQK